MKMAKWNLLEIQIRPLNLGTHNESQVVKLNTDLDLFMANVIEQLLKKCKNVFAWMYKDLRGIPLHLAHHQIVLNTNLLTSHQTWYQVNPNYVAVIKQDLDKLLTAKFIVPMEEVTWLSPIVVVLKKNGKF